MKREEKAEEENLLLQPEESRPKPESEAVRQEHDK